MYGLSFKPSMGNTDIVVKNWKSRLNCTAMLIQQDACTEHSARKEWKSIKNSMRNYVTCCQQNKHKKCLIKSWAKLSSYIKINTYRFRIYHLRQHSRNSLMLVFHRTLFFYKDILSKKGPSMHSVCFYGIQNNAKMYLFAPIQFSQ